MKAKHVILGIHILNRTKDVGEVQSHLSDYGGWIKTRLGLHRTDGDATSKGGVLLLDMTDQEKCIELAGRLDAIKDVETQTMIFSHEV